MTMIAADVFRSILDWSADLPMWQRDALRRLWEQIELTDTDHEELLALCKGEHDALDEGESMPKARPLAAQHVPGGSPATSTVVLRSIKHVQSVNALAPNQTLKFCRDGLTIVYGRNASGKSGYTRILKKVCRSRHSGDILPNVYENGQSTAASATIDFSVNGKDKSVGWQDGEPVVDDLANISVFDSRSAAVHVDAANNVAYTPAVLDLLEGLARTCRAMKDRLEAIQGPLLSSQPTALRDCPCRDYTTVGRHLRDLSGETEMGPLEELAKLTDEDSRRIKTLQLDIGQDASAAASQLRSQKKRLEQSISWLDGVLQLISDDAAAQLKAGMRDAQIKEAASKAAASFLADGQPLANVGSDLWKELWAAARAYSTREAYPDSPFPVVDETDGERPLCIFCQQELDDESVTRLRTFEEFVAENTQRQAAVARTTVRNFLEQVSSIELGSAKCRSLIDQLRDELADQELAMTVARHLRSLRQRKAMLREVTNIGEWPRLRDLPSNPSADLRQTAAELGKRVVELQTLADSDNRHRKAKELHEMEDRQWLATVIEDVRTDISRRRRLAILQNCIEDTGTRVISIKSTEIAGALVTEALKSRFSDELAAFGLPHLRAELAQSGTEYGAPKFRVTIPAEMTAELGEVLSEGEYRCVATAAFLSELETADNRSAIVLDDPAGSLDHEYRTALAERLAEEAKTRQVIVFTHDPVFLARLTRGAVKRGVPRFYQHVCRGTDAVGLTDGNIPLRHRSPMDAIGHLTSRLSETRALFDKGKLMQWEEQVKLLLGNVRITWELAVEEVLAPVYRRFGDGVNTKGLRRLTVLQEDDCDIVDAARASCSRLLHSAAAATDEPGPTPDDVLKEIEKLRRWVEDLDTRQRRMG